MNNKGVSEAIGFMLIFMITMMGIGLVSLYGYPMLMKQQISADERNMEQVILSTQNDIKLLCYSNIPYRDAMMRVSSGSLSVHNGTETGHEFTISNESGPLKTFNPGELRYRSDQGDAIISLENGAVIRRNKFTEGSVMLAEPRWFVDGSTGTFVIFLIGIESDNAMSLSGIGNMQMSMTGAPDVIDNVYDPPKTITIDYNSNDPENDYSKAWENYLTGPSLGMTKSGDSYQIGVSRLVIKEYKIHIDRL